MNSVTKLCAICGEPFTLGHVAYCRPCYNAYQRWRKQNIDRDHSMYEFREHLKLNASVGITDIDKAVPIGRRGRPRRDVVAETEAPLDADQHPSECGCWMCEGFTSYEAWAESESGQEWSKQAGLGP